CGSNRPRLGCRRARRCWKWRSRERTLPCLHRQRGVIRVLRKHGFVHVSQKGSHQKWRHPNGRTSKVDPNLRPCTERWSDSSSNRLKTPAKRCSYVASASIGLTSALTRAALVTQTM